MKKYISLTIGSVLIAGILFYLFMHAESQMRQHHQAVLNLILNAKQTEAALDKDMLKSRALLLQNYDPIVDGSQSIDQICLDLKDKQYALYHFVNTDLDGAIDKYCDALENKLLNIETFKSKNAILRNSLLYIHKLASDRSFKTEVGAAKSIILYREVISSALVYSLVSNSESKDLLTRHLERANQILQAKPSENEDLFIVVAHAKKILQIKEVLDGLLDNVIVDSKTGPLLEDIQRTYFKNYIYTEDSAARYRLLLYSVGIFFFILIIYGVISLWKSAQALTHVNSTLENRVIERTRELQEEHRKAEQASVQFQAIFENAAFGIVGATEDQRLIIPNAAFQKMVGYSREELEQKTIYDITHPEDIAKTKIMRANANHSHGFNMTKRYIKKDGSILWAKVSVSVLPENDNVLKNVAIIEDVTAQREIEETLKNQQLQIQAAAIEKARTSGMSEIATSVLHNVGNVLNSANVGTEIIIRSIEKSEISGFYKANELLKANLSQIVDFLTKDPKGIKLLNFYLELGEAMKNEFQLLKDEAYALMKKLQLIKDIINTQQTYAMGRAEYREEASLVEVVENALVMQASSLTRHDIKIVKKFSEIAPISLQKTKLIHVVLNLIKNAKEAMSNVKENERILTLEVGKTEQGVPFLSVSDSGEGIEKGNLTKMFSHGFTTKNTGHGFGLHFCANSATEMGAKIAVFSEGRGRGAKFQITFDGENNEAKAG